MVALSAAATWSENQTWTACRRVAFSAELSQRTGSGQKKPAHLTDRSVARNEAEKAGKRLNPPVGSPSKTLVEFHLPLVCPWESCNVRAAGRCYSPGFSGGVEPAHVVTLD